MSQHDLALTLVLAVALGWAWSETGDLER